MADDYSDDKTTTGVLAINSVATGNIDGDFDTDWFRFDARAGGHYRFSVVSPSSVDAHGATIEPMLNVFDANGQWLPIYANGLLEPSKDATYFISVYNGSTRGSYAIRATAVADDFGGSYETASTFWAGGSTSGTLNYENDIDRFKISVSEGNYYTIKLTTSDLASAEAMQFNLTSATGEYLGWVNPVYTASGLQMTILSPVTGDVYIDAIHRGWGAPTPIGYTLSASNPFKDEYGGTVATSAAATLDVPITGALQNAADVDMFKVMLTAGRTYSISWNTGASDARNPDRISMEVSDASGKTIGGAIYTDLTYKTVTPTVTGYHYVSLRGREGDYTMTLGLAADDYTANKSTAGRLILGEDSAGKLELGGSDRDWFSVRLTAGTTYHFSADSKTWGYGVMRLLDSAGKELLQSTTGSGSKFVETAAYVPTRTGTYYVEVASANGETQSYTVNARVGERDDYSGTSATATAIALNQPISGKLEVARDVDTFKLSVEAGKIYGVLPTSIGGLSIDVGLSTSAGTIGPVDYWYGGGASGGKVYTATTTGDLYIKVSGYAAGQYKLTALDFGADDFGADAASAGVLSASGSIQASLSNPIDRDVFLVTLQAGKSYVFELLGSSSGNGTLNVTNHQFSVRSINYTSVQEVLLRDSVEPRIMVTPSTSGDYLINVSNYNGQMGSYTVKAVTLSGDVTAPTLLTQSHAHNAVDVPLTSRKIEFTFSEAISIDRSAITLTDATGKSVTSIWSSSQGPWVSDNKLVFDAGSYLTPGTYTLSMPHQSVHDLAGNAYQGPETLTFTTVMPSTVGTSGADLLAPVRGVATNGGAGIDTVIYGAEVYLSNVDRDGNTTTLSTYQNGILVVDTLVDVERILFGGQAYALDVDGTAGQAYRLYRAAFDRAPDLDGLGFWMTQMDKGMPLNKVAHQFLTSPESVRLYGENTSDTQFVTQLYQNVLDREPEAAGLQSWLNVLANGMSRAEVLTGFSESPENIGAVAKLIGEGFMYTLVA